MALRSGKASKKFYRSSFSGSQRMVHTKRRVRHASDSLAMARNSRLLARPRAVNPGRTWRMIKKFFIGFIVLFWLCLPLYVPYFRISVTSYQGIYNSELRSSTEDAVREALGGPRTWFPKNNFFLFKTAPLVDEIRKLPLVQDVEVTKTFPNALTVAVIEKTKQFLYTRNGTDFYVLDDRGGVLEFPTTASSTDQPAGSPTASTSSPATISIAVSAETKKELSRRYGLMPIIIDARQGTLEDLVASKGLSPQLIEAVSGWFVTLSKSSVGSAQTITIEGESLSSRLVITTSKPWKIIAGSLRPGATEDIEAIESVLKQQTPKEYIDIRFKEKIFWK